EGELPGHARGGRDQAQAHDDEVQAHRLVRALEQLFRADQEDGIQEQKKPKSHAYPQSVPRRSGDDGLTGALRTTVLFESIESTTVSDWASGRPASLRDPSTRGFGSRTRSRTPA